MKLEGFPTYEIAIEDADFMIATDYEDLLYYDGPIVWTGKNVDGERLLGWNCWWDGEDKFNRDIVFHVAEPLYEDYVTGKLAYPDVIKMATWVCVMDWCNGVTNWYRIPYGMVPQEHLPSSEAFLV